MDSDAKLYFQRAENKLILAKTTFDISTDQKNKELLGIQKDKTFFNDVISDAYFSIFYAAKAVLKTKGIKTSAPEEHKKTYNEFKNLVLIGAFDKKLLEIYDLESLKAETLLDIFFSEKRKRGIFTYNVKSDANIPYAKESLSNAKTFLSAINGILNKR